MRRTISQGPLEKALISNSNIKISCTIPPEARAAEIRDNRERDTIKGFGIGDNIIRRVRPLVGVQEGDRAQGKVFRLDMLDLAGRACDLGHVQAEDADRQGHHNDDDHQDGHKNHTTLILSQLAQHNAFSYPLDGVSPPLREPTRQYNFCILDT